jgi:lipopolysaccharide export system permease protein
LDTLSKYISTDYLVTFLLTLLVFTFVMCVGVVIKAIDLLCRGVSGWIMLSYLARSIPYSLTFAIPMSALTSVLLQFSHMSLDGEIIAMKASGMTMWQIVSVPVVISILLSAVCVYLNCFAAPNSHFAQRRLLRDVGVEEPVNLLEEGRFVQDFPGIMIYVGKKGKPGEAEGGGTAVKEVIVYEMGDYGVARNVRAKDGVITADRQNHLLRVDLYDVRIDQPDPDDPTDLSRARRITAQHYPVKLDFDRLWNQKEIRKKISDMTMGELVRSIHNIEEMYPDLDYDDLVKERMAMVVEANERLALSLSCFAFTLLGIPLGMRSKRKESSIGVGVSLLLVFLFYLFIIVAEAMVGHPEFHPDLIIWAPVVLAEIAGFIMIQRYN